MQKCNGTGMDQRGLSFLGINSIGSGIVLFLILLMAWDRICAAPASGLIVKKAKTAASNELPGADSYIDQPLLLDDIQKKLAATRELASQADATTGEDVDQRQFLLNMLVHLYERQIERLQSLELLKQRRIRLKEEIARWTEPKTLPADPFLRADKLKTSVSILDKRLAKLSAGVAVIDLEILRKIEVSKDSAIKLRQVNEKLENIPENTNEQVKLVQMRDLLALTNQIDLARAVGVQIEKLKIQQEFLETQLQRDFAEKQLGAMVSPLPFTQSELDQVRVNLETERRKIYTEIKQSEEALKLQNKNPKESGLMPGIQPDSLDLEDLQPIQHENTELKLQALYLLLDLRQIQETVWEQRWANINTYDREKAREAYTRISKLIKELEVIEDYMEYSRDLILDLIIDRRIKIESSRVVESIEQEDAGSQLFIKRAMLYSRVLGEIESTELLLKRWMQELDERFQIKSISDRIDEILRVASDWISSLWQLEIFAAEDTIEVDGQKISGKRSITSGKILTALAILIFGYWLAVRVAVLIERIAVVRFGVDESLARIARRWIMFLQIFILITVSMVIVNIPLTIFAFMGGAVAIGAGFGMQNMLKNLISGLMLFLERPFRPGDLVEVGGIRGRVTDIGIRSSHIRDANGIETLIPNSTFIEQNVTNWTLSSQSVRIAVKIGVAYGSPVQEVSDLLVEAAGRHGLVLEKPAPEVLFEDFGSDALLFGLYVWVELKPGVDWRTIASDLRYMMNKSLITKGIVIAYPQRDVHFDTRGPLEVRVLSDK